LLISILFGPLGIKDYEWMKMRDGYYDGSGLLSIRLRTADMVKLGQTMSHYGRRGEDQIVPYSWANEIIEPKRTYSTLWGIDGSTYALCWYHKVYKGRTC
jgi:hypothetical protein